MLSVGAWWNKRNLGVVMGVSDSAGDCALLTRGDLDCDGKITIADFAIWKKNYLEFKILPKVSPVLSCNWCGNSCMPSDYKGACLDVMPDPGLGCEAKGGECVVVGAEVTLGARTEPTGLIVKPTGNLGCKWCGNQCVSEDFSEACLMIAPPEGKTCEMVEGKCQVLSKLKGCSDVCTSDADCESSYCYKTSSESDRTANGVCRMKTCPDKTDCACSVAPSLINDN